MSSFHSQGQLERVSENVYERQQSFHFTDSLSSMVKILIRLPSAPKLREKRYNI